MTTAQTKITRRDLQVYPSERLTDNDDGGGMPLGTALTGADNELFNPISAIAWLNGGFYARLVYMGVKRDDDEPLLGAYTAITVPPKNPNVSYLMFQATKFGELRQEIIKRIENYVVGTIESRMTLLSTQSKYSKIVQAYQRQGEPLPLVGDVFELKQEKNGYKTASQFIKVLKATAEDRIFVDPETNKEFTVTVVKMEISTKLSEDFIGVDYPSRTYVDNPCKIHETHVADAGNYYGVQPLTKAIKAHDTSVEISSIFAKIIPTNEVSQPLLDMNAGELKTLSFEVGNAIKQKMRDSPYFRKNKQYNLYLSNSCAVGSVNIKFYHGANPITDKGGKLYQNGVECGFVDYEHGKIAFTYLDSYAQLNCIEYKVASVKQQISDTAKIDVTLNNHSAEYAITIEPPPPLATVSVSYRSQGVWYTLQDLGDGTLKGASKNHGSGNVNVQTGTVNISCGELPDVGSSVVFSWGSKAQYFNRSAIDCSAKMALQLANDADPSSIVLTWNNGGAKTATCNAQGEITGDWTGKFKQADNQILIDTGQYFNHPKGVLDINVSYSKGEKKHIKFTAPIRNSEGKIELDLGDTPIKPNTFKLMWNLLIEDYQHITKGELKTRLVDPYKTVRDDGNGNIIDQDGNTIGTINYSERKAVFNPETTVMIPKSTYKKIKVGEEIVSEENEQGEETYQDVFRHMFTGYEYIPAGASMPIDETAFAEVWFYDTSPTSTVTENLTSGNIVIDLLENYAETIVANTVNFQWGYKKYFDRNGKIYTDFNMRTGEGVFAGTIDYQKGVASLNNWYWNDGDNPTINALASYINANPVDSVTFRTPKAPIRNASLSVRAVATNGELLTATADTSGKITGDFAKGTVDVQFGVADVKFGELVDAIGKEGEEWFDSKAVKNGKIWQPRHVFADTVMYNAFAYSSLPINSQIIKIDTVRLPQNGKVPIFRRGDSILISNSKTQDLGSAFQGGQTINLSRNDIDRICLKDSNNVPINAELWDYDLENGTITWATPLDLSSYQMPIIATHSQEERNRVLEVDISGQLKLLEPMMRDYPIEDTYVSSLLIGDNLQVRHSIPFTQRNWDGVWRDEPQGEQLLNRLNLTDYPMILTDDGAITQDWLIKFTSANQFEVYGDALGYVGQFDTLTDLAPINPATSKPYFTINKSAFGGSAGQSASWASHDVIRFKTWGTLMPVWILCSAQPTNKPQKGTDGFKYCFYGDTTEI